MQYLLTEQEYRNLVDAAKRQKKNFQHTLQNLCSRVANHEPMKVGYDYEEIPVEKRKPWGCMLEYHDGEVYESAWHCDLCPVRELCPYEKKKYQLIIPSENVVLGLKDLPEKKED